MGEGKWLPHPHPSYLAALGLGMIPWLAVGGATHTSQATRKCRVYRPGLLKSGGRHWSQRAHWHCGRLGLGTPHLGPFPSFSALLPFPPQDHGVLDCWGAPTVLSSVTAPLEGAHVPLQHWLLLDQFGEVAPTLCKLIPLWGGRVGGGHFGRGVWVGALWAAS
uniref:Uncharacterized protein n=1 Tax=Sphaerodactylus townsendi TaxID=933632 RepID=A0ACB8E9Z9_9SAUR